MLHYIYSIALALALVGCQRSTLLHAYRPVSTRDFYLKDTVRFDIPATDEGGEWDISLGVRYRHDYKYQSLFLVVEQLYHDPAFNLRDTVEVRLDDDRGAALVTHEQAVTSTLLAPHQSGVVKVYHITHPAHLQGISDIGLRLKRTERQ